MFKTGKEELAARTYIFICRASGIRFRPLHGTSQLVVNWYIDIPLSFSGPHTGLRMVIPWVTPAAAQPQLKSASFFVCLLQ